MKVKFGMIVTEARNKLGGHVASVNRSGAYFRTRVTPANPQTDLQSLARARLGTLAAAWRSLTAAQRSAWNSAVDNFVELDIFGDARTPSGFQLFMKLNSNMVAIGETANDDPPAVEAVELISSLSVAWDIGAGNSGLTYAPAFTAVTKVKLYATPPQSAGKFFVKSEYRHIYTMPYTDSSPFDCTTEYEDVFGEPGVGTKIFFKMIPVTVAGGVAGPEISASAIVVETS